jgi:hydroxymethylglutaryl-CoA lyase
MSVDVTEGRTAAGFPHGLPARVELVEVGPRDGLQVLDRSYPTRTKLELIQALAAVGIRRIEVTSFGRPDVVPALADADELSALLPRDGACRYRALVPNLRGVERAIAAGMDEILILTAASEAYSRRNQGVSIDGALSALEQSVSLAAEARIRPVVGIAMAMWCPYEGEVPFERVARIAERTAGLGVEELVVASSAGLDAPRHVHALCSGIRRNWPELTLGLHLHNTNGLAFANAMVAAEAGVSVFEGAVCGIGGGVKFPTGMPYYGNIATEDLVAFFSDLGVETGLDTATFTAAARRVADLLELERLGSYRLNGASREQVQALSGGAA